MIRNTLSRLARSRLVPGAVGGLVVAAVLAGPGAWAAVTSSNPSASTTYTGCLGHTSGSIYDVQQGNAPLASCTTKDKQIKLSAGDITGVAAGSGLTGGATKGNATLALDPAYALPVDCPLELSPTSSGDGTWDCLRMSQQFSYPAVSSGTFQTAYYGGFGIELKCGATAATVSASDIFGTASGTFNALVGVLNGSASDVGFPVAAGAEGQFASNGGGTATFVWDDGSDGVVTGTVTWFLEGPGGACQFDGDLVHSTP